LVYSSAMSPVIPKTDPTGRCFVSYRSTRLSEIERLIPCLHEHGIPTWQDRKNLASEPTIEAIQKALDCPSTSSAILWLSEDVATSRVILDEEAPRIVRRARASDGFTAKLCLANGLEFAAASGILKMLGSLESPSKTWNLRPIDGDPATDEAILGVARAALSRRLAAIHAALPPGEPLRIAFHAHAQARPAFETGYALMVDWTRHFQLRHASSDAWSGQMLPALATIVDAIRTAAPRRAVLAEGFVSIASAFAIGRSFMEPCGIPLTWRQLPKGDEWTLSSSRSDPGFSAKLASQDVSASALAVLVSIRGNVEPAVVASGTTVPAFRAILLVQPQNGQATAHLENSEQASHLARLVADRIREARSTYAGIRTTHLFYSGPVGVAMMIGQQLNALGPVQLYEHRQTPEDAVGSYVPAALLCDSPNCV
jgi:hypothetical protein